MVNSVRVCKVDVMTDQLEQAKLEGIEQGKRLQRLQDVEDGLDDLREALERHQTECEVKTEKLYTEVKELRAEVSQGQKMLYAGLGILIAVQTAIALIGPSLDFFK